MPALCSISDQTGEIDTLQNVQLELGTTPGDLQALVAQARGEDEEDVVYAFFIDNV